MLGRCSGYQRKAPGPGQAGTELYQHGGPNMIWAFLGKVGKNLWSLCISIHAAYTISLSKKEKGCEHSNCKWNTMLATFLWVSHLQSVEPRKLVAGACAAPAEAGGGVAGATGRERFTAEALVKRGFEHVYLGSGYCWYHVSIRLDMSTPKKFGYRPRAETAWPLRFYFPS